MPATWHNVHFGMGPGTNVFLKLGPTTEVGPWMFGQFRIPELTGGYRVQGAEIPFAPGLKDVGDGEREAGTVTVEGWVHFTNTYTADVVAKAILSYFYQKKDFYVWYSYSGVGSTPQKLRRLKSYRIGEADTWGGERWDISLTFAVFDPEF